jgi:glutamate racemase
MTFPQSKLDLWAHMQGKTHGEFMTDAIAAAFNEGYVMAYPHAAKHTVERVIEILKKETEEYQGALGELRIYTVADIEKVLREETW